MVSTWGMTAETASEGNEALDKMSSFNPDVILTYINMPGLDGFGFLQKLRELVHAGDLEPAALSLQKLEEELDRLRPGLLELAEVQHEGAGRRG